MSILLFFTILISCVYPVNERMMNLSQNDHKYLKKMIKRSSDLECSNELEEIHAFYIFNIAYNVNITKSDFKDPSSLYNKVKLVDIKGSPFPDNIALLLNNKKEVRYCFFNTQGFCSATESIEEKIMKYTIEAGGHYAMHILGSNISIFLMEKDNELQVMDLRDGSLKVKPMHDFLDCCWKDFFPH